MKYDAIIIGAGLSGLAAGIRLAYYEKKVCVLERHTTIGGLNSFYRLKGRNYDVGLHAVTNYAVPGTKTGVLSKLLRQLRLGWDDFALCPQFGSAVAFPGCRLDFSNEPDFLTSEVERAFPAQAESFRRMTALIDSIPEADAIANTQSAREFLRSYLSDPLLVEMLMCPLMFYGSATPMDMRFWPFVIMFRSVYREGFGRPYEGVRRILKALTRHYKALGGELRLRAGVSAIEVTNETAHTVILDSGDRLEGKCILSSAGFLETLRMCQPPLAAPLENEARSEGEITFVETNSTLSCDPAEFGFRSTILFYNDCPDFVYENPHDPCDVRSGIIASPNNFVYDRPLEEGTVRITALANKDYWMNLPEPEYLAAKETWYRKIVESAIRFMPDFRPKVIDTDTFTPRTIRKFTGHLNGNVYGTPKKHWDGLTPVKNLIICGTDQGYLGITGSMVSGIAMANSHVLRDS